jgi:hypothetical protein
VPENRKRDFNDMISKLHRVAHKTKLFATLKEMFSQKLSLEFQTLSTLHASLQNLTPS